MVRTGANFSPSRSPTSRATAAAASGKPYDCCHAAVTVTLSSAYGEISGTVRDDKGPVAGANVVAREASNPSMGMYAATTSQADGTYNIKSVAPGTYQLMVMDESETITSDASADDYDEFAEKVEVRPKETVTRDLKVGR